MLFYNMIYTHHSRININDLLNKFPIICYIRKCVETTSVRCIFTFKKKIFYFVFIAWNSVLLWRDNVDDDHDEEEEEEDEENNDKRRRRTYNTIKINNEILWDVLCISKCISPIIQCSSVWLRVRVALFVSMAKMCVIIFQYLRLTFSGHLCEPQCYLVLMFIIVLIIYFALAHSIFHFILCWWFFFLLKRESEFISGDAAVIGRTLLD